MKINQTDINFLKVFCNVDFNYIIICKYMPLINLVSEIDKTTNLAIKLHVKFIEPIFNIVKDKIRHHISIDNDFDDFYNNFSKEERLKMKKFINNNIDIFEIVFTPMHKFINQVRHYHCMCNYPCNCKKKCECHNNVYCCKTKYDLRRILFFYDDLENLKYLYLLQRCIINNKYHHWNKLDTIRDIFSRVKHDIIYW